MSALLSSSSSTTSQLPASAAVISGVYPTCEVEKIKLCCYKLKVNLYTYAVQSAHPLGQKNISRLVRCPDFRGCKVGNRIFGTAKCVLYIDAAHFRGVLNKGFNCIAIVYT